MKTRGKGSRSYLVTGMKGKPQELKDQISCGCNLIAKELLAQFARAVTGRLIDHFSNDVTR